MVFNMLNNCLYYAPAGKDINCPAALAKKADISWLIRRWKAAEQKQRDQSVLNECVENDKGRDL